MKKSEKNTSAHVFFDPWDPKLYLINAFFDQNRGLKIFFRCSEACLSVKMSQTPPWDGRADLHKIFFGLTTTPPPPTEPAIALAYSSGSRTSWVTYKGSIFPKKGGGRG